MLVNSVVVNTAQNTNTPGSYNIPIPIGTSSIAFVIWGAGGGGGTIAHAPPGGNGGGGGAIITAPLNVLPLSTTQSINLVVGAGGKGGFDRFVSRVPPDNGGDTILTISNSSGTQIAFSAGGGSKGGDAVATGGIAAIIQSATNPYGPIPPSIVAVNGAGGHSNLNVSLSFPIIPTTVVTLAGKTNLGGGVGYGGNGGDGVIAEFDGTAGGGGLGAGGGGYSRTNEGSSIRGGDGGDGGAVIVFT